MTALATQPRTRRTQAPSAFALTMDFEQTLIEAVEATIAAGLEQARATPAVGERVATAWRDALMFAAADELSTQMVAQADRSRRTGAYGTALRRALAPYAALVATAAETEGRRGPGEFLAAD